MLAGDGGQQ
jgi:transposase